MKTAEELSLVLPVPLLLLIEGSAQVQFPEANSGFPSPFVMIIGAKPNLTGLPVTLSEGVWTKLVYPLLHDQVIQGWVGKPWAIGDQIQTLEDILGADGVVIYPEGLDAGTSKWSQASVGSLFRGSSRDVARLLSLMSRLILQRAKSLGY